MSDVAPLVLGSLSRAGDAGYLAAKDVADIAAALAVPYRLIGGNAVTLLTAVHGATDRVPARETSDADFAASYQVVGDPRLLPALTGRGYTQVKGNRFMRTLALPAQTSPPAVAGSWDLVMDVLAPSYQDRMISNQSHGQLVVDEVPGLAFALGRPATHVQIEVRLTSGHELQATLELPDLLSALVLKTYAYTGRYADRDALDLWRLLEAGAAAGITSQDWPPGPSTTYAAGTLRQFFGRPAAAGLGQASQRRADQTRIVALVSALVPTL